MAIVQNSRIEYTDLQNVYTTFNTFISTFGGSITTLTIPPQALVEDTDVNDLDAKITEFKNDTYLSTQSSWWVNGTVTAGDLAKGIDWAGVNTTMGNFPRVKCRNQGTYQNTNHSNTCSQGTRSVSCSHTNRNHNCSNGANSVSCTNGNRNHNCSNGANSVSCSNGNRNHNCSNGANSVSCSNGNRNHNCSNGANSVSCSNTLKTNNCSNGNHSNTCSQGTRTVEETGSNGYFIGLCTQTFTVPMRRCTKHSGCNQNPSYSTQNVTFSLCDHSSYNYQLDAVTYAQDILYRIHFTTFPFSATCSHASRTVTETLSSNICNHVMYVRDLNIPVYVNYNTYQQNSVLNYVQSTVNSTINLQARDYWASYHLLHELGQGFYDNPIRFNHSATCTYGANSVACSHTARSVNCSHQYHSNTCSQGTRNVACNPNGTHGNTCSQGTRNVSCNPNGQHGNTCSQGTRNVTCNPNGQHGNTCSQGTRNVACNPNGQHSNACSDGPNSVSCSYTAKGHQTFIDITCVHQSRNGQ